MLLPITRGLPAMSVASCSPSVDVPASINSLPALRLQSAEASAAFCSSVVARPVNVLGAVKFDASASGLPMQFDTPFMAPDSGHSAIFDTVGSALRLALCCTVQLAALPDRMHMPAPRNAILLYTTHPSAVPPCKNIPPPEPPALSPYSVASALQFHTLAWVSVLPVATLIPPPLRLWQSVTVTFSAVAAYCTLSFLSSTPMVYRPPPAEE